MTGARALWLLLCAGAVTALVASGWLVPSHTKSTLPEKPPPRADYYLRDAVVEVMDENGQLSYRLRTRELLRFNDRTSQMTDLQIDSLGGRQGVWQLQAGKAVVTENQEKLLLTGDVRMQTQGPGGATRLSTPTLTVELQNDRMTTPDPVQVQGPEFSAQATGMQASFKSRDLTLMNNVRTRYAP